MHTRTVRPAAADEPTVTEDPFADLLDDLGSEESLEVETDDAPELHDLFAAAPPRAPAETTAPPGSHWPQHNYGPAYRSMRRDTSVRRRPLAISESDLWDVDRLTHEPTPEPPTAAPVHIPWRTSSPSADPTGWLDALDSGPVDPDATEARLVDLVWGRPLEKDLLEATDVLHARPRNARLVGQVSIPKKARIGRPVRIAALAFLLLFALAVLQLLLS